MFAVVPRRGAWIETFIVRGLPSSAHVVPRRGAWIETEPCKLSQSCTIGRPPQGGVD